MDSRTIRQIIPDTLARVGVLIDSTIKKAAQIHFSSGAFEKARDTVELLLDSKRPSVRKWAAKFILDHQRDLYKAEKPQEMKHEFNFPTELTIRGVKPGEV